MLKTKIRTCLKCRHKFKSKGDRICPRCTTVNSKTYFKEAAIIMHSNKEVYIE